MHICLIYLGWWFFFNKILVIKANLDLIKMPYQKERLNMEGKRKGEKMGRYTQSV
jgi:hypothetical protein